MIPEETDALFNVIKALQAQCTSHIEDKIKSLTEFSNELNRELNKSPSKPLVKPENPAVESKMEQVSSIKPPIPTAASNSIIIIERPPGPATTERTKIRKIEDDSEDENVLYCVCKQPSDGNMVACDAKEVLITIKIV